MDRSPSAENRAPYSNDSERKNRNSPMKSQKLTSDVDRRFSGKGTSKSVLYSPEVSYVREKEGLRIPSVSPKKSVSRKSPAKKEKSYLEEIIFQERKKLEDIPRQHQQDYHNLMVSQSNRRKPESTSASSSTTEITFIGSKSMAIPLSETELCDEYKEILKKLEHVAKNREEQHLENEQQHFVDENEVINLNISSIEKETELAEKRLMEKHTISSVPLTILDDAGYAVPQRVEEREKSLGFSDEFRSPFDSPSKLNDSNITPVNRSSPDELFYTPMVDRKKHTDYSRPTDRNLINHQVEKVSNTLKRMSNDDKNELENTSWRSPQKKITNEISYPDFDSYRQSMPNTQCRNIVETRISLQHIHGETERPFSSITEVCENKCESNVPDSLLEQNNLIRPESYGTSLSVHMKYSEHMDSMEKRLTEAEKINSSYVSFKEKQLDELENTTNPPESSKTEKNENQDIDDMLDGIELFESTLIEPVLVPKRRVKPAQLPSITEDSEAKTFGRSLRTAARAEAGVFKKNSAPIRNAVEKYCSDVKTLEKLELKKLLVYKKLGMCPTELKTMEVDIKTFTESMISDSQMWVKNNVGKEFIDQRCKQLAKMYSKVSVEIKLLASLLSKQFDSGRKSSIQVLPVHNVKTDHDQQKKEVEQVAVVEDAIVEKESEIIDFLGGDKEIKNEIVDNSVHQEFEYSNLKKDVSSEKEDSIPSELENESNRSLTVPPTEEEENLEKDEEEPTTPRLDEECVHEESLPVFEDKIQDLSSANSEEQNSAVASVFSSAELEKDDLFDQVDDQLNISSSRPPSVVPPLNLSSLLDDSTSIPQQAESEKINSSTRRDSLISLNESELSSRLNISERSEGQRKNMSERFMTISPKSSPQVPSRQFPVFSLDFTFNDSRLFNEGLSPSKLDKSEKAKEEDHEETPKKMVNEIVTSMQPQPFKKSTALFPEFTLNDSSEDFDDFLGVCSNLKPTTQDSAVSPALLTTSSNESVSTQNVDSEELMKMIRSEEWTMKTMMELCDVVYEQKSADGFDGFEDVDIFENLERLKSELPGKKFSTDERLQEMNDELRVLFYASVLNVAADLWPKRKEGGLFGYPKPSLYCTAKAPKTVTRNDFVQACMNRIVKPKDLYPLSGRFFKNDSDPEKLALQLIYCDRGFMDKNISKRIEELEEKIVDNVTDAVESEVINSISKDDREDQSTSLFGSFNNSSFFSQGLMEGRFSIGRRSSITRESLAKRTPSPLILTKIEE